MHVLFFTCLSKKSEPEDDEGGPLNTSLTNLGWLSLLGEEVPDQPMAEDQPQPPRTPQSQSQSQSNPQPQPMVDDEELHSITIDMDLPNEFSSQVVALCDVVDVNATSIQQVHLKP